jgi:tRNA threonylcarbamoyladenosine biosynthesis protein TsaB
VSLAKDGQTILCKEIAEQGYSHAERLHVFIEEILKKTNVEELSKTLREKGF